MLKFFPHPEGYVEFKNNQYLYTYQYKDHLGNIRLTYRDGYRNHPTLEYAKDGVIQVTEIIEESNYYPFGLKHKGYNDLADYSATNKYKYAYGGKELNDELGLDLYDFGARNYDAAIGRWLNVDPLAENSRRWTPYNYAYNNPIVFVDPDGMQSISLVDDPIHDRQGNLIGDDGKTGGKAYVVQGKVEDRVREATASGQFYTGDLELGTNGASVPTGDVLDEVINSVNDTDANKVENGGHSLIGENKATRWDPGPEYKEEQIADRPGSDATYKVTASINSFVTNTKRLSFSKLKDVEFAWHTHPLITSPRGGRLGTSNPSGSNDGRKSGDITNMIKYESYGFRGTAFVIGMRDKNVQFYNGKGSYLKISYDVFKKIGGKN